MLLQVSWILPFDASTPDEFLALQILKSASSSYVKSSQTRLAFGLPVVLNEVLNGAAMAICLTGTAASWYTEHVLCMHAWFTH